MLGITKIKKLLQTPMFLKSLVFITQRVYEWTEMAITLKHLSEKFYLSILLLILLLRLKKILNMVVVGP